MSLSKQMRYVSVHKNLNTGRYSVVDRESGSPTYGKVTDSLDDLTLVDCRFRVGKKGRERVLREKQKNVHARVWGHMIEEVPEYQFDSFSFNTHWDGVHYNPYYNESFMRSKNTPVFYTDVCVFSKNSVLCLYKYTLTTKDGRVIEADTIESLKEKLGENQ